MHSQLTVLKRSRVALETQLRKFDPNQKRADDGKWTDGGGSSGGPSKKKPGVARRVAGAAVKHYVKRAIKATLLTATGVGIGATVVGAAVAGGGAVGLGAALIGVLGYKAAFYLIDSAVDRVVEDYGRTVVRKADSSWKDRVGALTPKQQERFIDEILNSIDDAQAEKVLSVIKMRADLNKVGRSSYA